MPENPYTLRVPIAKDQWIVLVSNKAMTSTAFAALDRWLVLQKEAVAEEESASAIEAAGAVETVKHGPTRSARAGAEGIAQRHD